MVPMQGVRGAQQKLFSVMSVRGCGCEAPARKSSYFVSTSVRVRLDQVRVCVRFGLGEV